MIFLELFTKFKLWIVGAAAFVLALAYAFWRGYGGGTQAAVVEAQKARERAIAKRKETENEVKQMDDAALDKYNSRWLRK